MIQALHYFSNKWHAENWRIVGFGCKPINQDTEPNLDASLDIDLTRLKGVSTEILFTLVL